MFGFGVEILAFALMLGAIAAALGAATARSLVATSLFLSTAAALTAAALVALGAGDAALGVTLLGVGLAPVLLLGAMTLSTRAARKRKGAPPWIAIGAAMMAVSALVWAAIAPRGSLAALDGVAMAPGVASWLAVLVFAVVAATLGLLGFGERGALERASRLDFDA